MGDPLGIQARYFTSWKRALAFMVGYSSAQTLQGTVDYLFYGYNAQDKVIDKDFWNSLIFYGGFGALGGYGLPGADPNNNVQFGLRVVGGIEYIFVGTPWAMRTEIAPELFLKGKNTTGLELGIGITYYWWDGSEQTRTRAAPKVRTQPVSTPSQNELNEFK